MRKLIYSIKRFLQINRFIYSGLYAIATINRIKVSQFLNRSKFSSKYGGMWTDRTDFTRLLEGKVKRGELGSENSHLIQHWHEQGFVILRNAIPTDLIERYEQSLLLFQQQPESPLLITGAKFKGQRKYHEEELQPEDSIRVIDDYFFLDEAKELLLNDSITEFLDLVFETKPILTQSLNFRYGSGQSLHQDTAFVRVTSPMALAASWIALEDVQPDSGELMYVPGSHKWTDFLFSGSYTHYDEERDGPEELARWHAWLRDKTDASGGAVRFLPKKGDVLIWHGGLAHGGSAFKGEDVTRKSLVGHYCPHGARPLYHFYKPQSRRIYREACGAYTSSYYR